MLSINMLVAISGHGGDDYGDPNCWWEQQMVILGNDIKQLSRKKITFCDALVHNGHKKLEANLLIKQNLNRAR